MRNIASRFAVILVSTACMLFANGLAIADEPPTELACSGTEPFWQLHVETGQAKFHHWDNEERTDKLTVNRSESVANRIGSWVYFLAVPSGEFTAIAVVQRTACDDGMSDINYAHEITLVTVDGKGQVLSGCCE